MSACSCGFPELPLDEVARLEALGGSEINEAKKILATEVTQLCREDIVLQVAETARQTFEVGQSAEGLPTTEVARGDLGGLGLVEALNRAGLVASNGEARRLIRGGGARVTMSRPMTRPQPWRKRT